MKRSSLLVALALFGCTHTQPSNVSATVEAETESSSTEIIERIEELSPYDGDEAGLTQLWRDVVARAAANDREGIDAILERLEPVPDDISLAFTFEGGNTLVPYIAGPAALPTEDFISEALGYGGRTEITVTSATGAEIQGSGVLTNVSPNMRSIGPQLRPLPRWYRVTLSEPGGARPIVLESFIFVGGRWMYTRNPWRFAPGSPDRATTVPTQSWARRMPAN